MRIDTRDTADACSADITVTTTLLVTVLHCLSFNPQSNVARKLNQIEEQFGVSCSKVAEYEVVIGALRTSQSKLQSENGELNSQLSDAESRNGSLAKNNNNLTAQLDETKSELEMEAAVSSLSLTNQKCQKKINGLSTFKSDIQCKTKSFSYRDR